MTSPPTTITVVCPPCSEVYEDFERASVNLDLDDFEEEYLRRCETAVCPSCGHVVELDMLVVRGNIWTFRRAWSHEQEEGNHGSSA